MRIFLLWISRDKRNSNPQVVSTKLQKLFSKLFDTPIESRVLSAPPFAAVFLQLPVRGWNAPFYEEEGPDWAFAGEYPLNVRSVVNTSSNMLLTLGRKLQNEPAFTLAELAPPFSLAWSSHEAEEILLQNDGLGQAQLFETDQKNVFAISNKLMAFSALEIPVIADPEQWATRCTLGWFPLAETGFQGISFVQPGTQFRFSADGVLRKKYNVLKDWLHPADLTKIECLELARNSLIKFIGDVSPSWEKPSVGLSGGWDSRAVVSCLRHVNANFSARVRGLPGRRDVPVAQELARLGGFEIRHKISGGIPPDDSQSCRRSISLALLWQAGSMVTHNQKSFLSHQKHLDGGVVNVMGQHGEIGRAYYAKMIDASQCQEEEYENRLLARLTKKIWMINPIYREIVMQKILEAYRQADQYDLKGLLRLDFFYLYERTRRWASASLNSQTGVVVAPFLNPGYIRATFAYQDSKEANPFHRFILQQNSPEWLDVPYANDVDVASDSTTEIGWKKAGKGEHYDSRGYWELIGYPILQEARSKGKFSATLFNFQSTDWTVDIPDELAMVYLLEDLLNSM